MGLGSPGTGRDRDGRPGNSRSIWIQQMFVALENPSLLFDYVENGLQTWFCSMKSLKHTKTHNIIHTIKICPGSFYQQIPENNGCFVKTIKQAMVV